jgi:molybdopterin-binding protein
MNILNGTINKITKVDSLILIEVEVSKKNFTSLVLEDNDNNQYMLGENVNIIFKETEVMVATPHSIISARNSFVSTIVDIEQGKLLCNITFSFGNYTINSIITKGAMEELQCNINDNFKWFIKSNEVIIQKI